MRLQAGLPVRSSSQRAIETYSTKVPALKNSPALLTVIAFVVFALAVCLQLWLEAAGKSDSLGLWYTLYCAATYTLVAGALGWGGYALARRVRRG